jgi:MFS family permease
MIVYLPISSAQRRNLAAAIICTSTVGTTMGLTWPLLALILDHQGIDSALIGLSAASQSLAVLVVSPLAPSLINRYGMVHTIGWCIAVILAALLLLPTLENVEAWFPIRFALGAGVAILQIASQTWVNQIAPDHIRGKIIGLFGLLWAGGFAAGPLAIRFTGIEGWPPFVIALCLTAVAALPLLFASETMSAERSYFPKSGLLTVFCVGGAAIAASAVLGILDSANDSFLPLYGLKNGLSRESAVTMLTVLLVGVLSIQLPIGWAADRMSRRGLLAAATVVALLTCLILPHAVSSGLAVWPILFIFGLGAGGIWTVSLVLVGQLVPSRNLATASMLQSVLYGLGSVLAPPFTGLVLDAWPNNGLPFVLASDCAVFAGLQLWLWAVKCERRSPK